jgi:hypothetical protein
LGDLAINANNHSPRRSALGKRNPGVEEVFKREKRTSESTIRGKKSNADEVIEDVPVANHSDYSNQWSFMADEYLSGMGGAAGSQAGIIDKSIGKGSDEYVSNYLSLRGICVNQVIRSDEFVAWTAVRRDLEEDIGRYLPG